MRRPQHRDDAVIKTLIRWVIRKSSLQSLRKSCFEAAVIIKRIKNHLIFSNVTLRWVCYGFNKQKLMRNSLHLAMVPIKPLIISVHRKTQPSIIQCPKVMPYSFLSNKLTLQVPIIRPNEWQTSEIKSMKCLKVLKIWIISWMFSVITWNHLWCPRPVRRKDSYTQRMIKKSSKRHYWILGTVQAPYNRIDTYRELSEITTWSRWVIMRCKEVPLGNNGLIRQKLILINQNESRVVMSKLKI